MEVESDASMDEADVAGNQEFGGGAGAFAALLPPEMLLVRLVPKLLRELLQTVPSFWLRRVTRRKVSLQLAEECARFGPLVRRKAAELRAAAAQRRLDMLKAGDMEAYASLLGESKDGRVREILDETERILAELKAPAAAQAAEEVEQPSLLKGADGQAKLLPHQLDGLRWLVSMVDSNMSGILADDMGLGKTIQTLALLAHLKEKRGEGGPHLVMAPLSTLPHWVEEVSTWLPDFKYLCFRGTTKELESMKEHMGKNIGSLNLVLTSYETAVSHANVFGHYPWDFVVVDEGQRLKNCKTRLSRIIRTFPCRHRLLLSGTPIQNSLRELWSLLAFVAPNSFGSLEDFEQWFALPAPPSLKLDACEEDARGAYKEDGAEAEVEAATSKLLSEEEEMLIIQRLHRVLRPFLLRRTKDLVLHQLPEKREVVIWTPLSSWQSDLYLKGLRRKGARASTTLELAHLRQTLNHPYHFLPGEVPAADSAEDRLVTASGKFELLDRLLPRLLGFGHKTLIFSQMTSLLDLLQLLLARKGIRYTRIDGTMTLPMRKRAEKLFRSEADVGVLLLTTRAGGLGLNLQVADTVVLFDSDWNPQVDLQAMDRVYRIGQQKPVLVIRLATPTHLDRGLLERAGRKIDMEQKVISAGRFCGNGSVSAPGAGKAGAGGAGGGEAGEAGEAEGAKDTQGFLRQLIVDERRRSAAAAAGESGGREATPLDEVNRLLARSTAEHAAFEAADLELLGPPAAAEGGAAETAAAHLERAGRLMGAEADRPRLAARGSASKMRLPPQKRPRRF